MVPEQKTACSIFGGTEVCHCCGQTYIYELAYTCSACDRSACPVCAANRWNSDDLCSECGLENPEEDRP